MQKKDTGHIYAMKMLRKKDMMDKEQVNSFSLIVACLFVKRKCFMKQLYSVYHISIKFTYTVSLTIFK